MHFPASWTTENSPWHAGNLLTNNCLVILSEATAFHSLPTAVYEFPDCWHLEASAGRQKKQSFVAAPLGLWVTQLHSVFGDERRSFFFF